MKRININPPVNDIQLDAVRETDNIIALNVANEIAGFVIITESGYQFITALYNTGDATCFKELKILILYFPHLKFYVL